MIMYNLENFDSQFIRFDSINQTSYNNFTPRVVKEVRQEFFWTLVLILIIVSLVLIYIKQKQDNVI